MSDNGRESNLNQLLFTDDTVLVPHSEEKLRQLVKECGGGVGARRKMRVNEGKSKVIHYTRRVHDRRMNVALNGKLLEEVEYLKYLGSHMQLMGR